MNVLFVTYDFPYPANSGGKNRAFNLLKITAKNHNVNLYSYVREDYNPDFNEEITSLGVSKINVFKRKKLKSLLMQRFWYFHILVGLATTQRLS